MAYREGTVQLSGPHYGYRRAGTRVKVIEASNLPDSPHGLRFWINQGRWKDDAVGALLEPGDWYNLRWKD